MALTGRLLRGTIVFAVIVVATAAAFRMMRQKPIDVPASIVRICERHAAAIRTAYVARRFQEHAELSAGMLRRLLDIPLANLEGCERALIQRVMRDGVQPYSTLLIDHGYRLGRNATLANDRRYQAIARAVRKKLEESTAPEQDAVTLIRTLSNDRVRPYSANAGHVVLALAYSAFGRAQFARRTTPEQLLRYLELYRNCSDRASRGSQEPQTDQEACQMLQREMNESMSGGAGPSIGQLVGMVSDGIWRGAFACAGAMVNMPGASSTRPDCQRDIQIARGDGTQFSASGAVGRRRGAYAPHRDGPENLRNLLKDAALEGEPILDEHVGPDGFGAQETYHYRRPDGHGGSERVTVGHYSTQYVDSSGQTREESGTMVQVSNSEGTTTHYYVNGSGYSGPNSTYWESSDGSTAYYATYNSNGTLKEETFVDEDGTVTHNTYDENGNLKSSEKKNANDPDAGTPTTQPDHEYDQSACPGLPRSAFGERPGGPGSTAPWILPDPDQAPVRHPDMCLNEYFRNRPQRCPPSVVQCVDEVPVGRCGCLASPPPGPRRPNLCERVDCGSDGTCDPATGACRGAQGGFFPGSGIIPPGPMIFGGPIRFGRPVDIRAGLPNQLRLWYPDPSNRRLTALFGMKPAAQ